MSNLLTAWRSNPVLVNELRSRMRGRRTFVALGVHLVIFSALIFMVYLIVYQDTQTSYGYYYGGGFQRMLQASANLGKGIFYSSAILLLLIVALVGPAFAAGAIVSEKERQTFDLLTITALGARQIVWGKLGAILVFMGLLILATLPFQSMAYFFGGIAFAEIALSAVILLLTTLLFCSLGIFVSTIARSTTIANMINYAAVVPLLFGVPFISFFFGIFSSGLFFADIFSEPPAIIAAVMTYIILFFLSINPLSMVITSEVFIQETGNYVFTIEEFFGAQIPIIAPWVIYAIFSLAMSFILIKAAISRVGQVQRT